MRAKMHAKARNGVFESDSRTERDPCGKLGAGFDVFTRKNVSAGIEVAQVWGWEGVDEIDYALFTLGLAYHF
jgi:hypothetical protein